MTVPALSGWNGELYRRAEETADETAPLSAIPYYAWDNREPGAMQVWVRED